MRQPTAEEVRTFQRLMNQANLENILAFLRANPDLDVNDIRDRTIGYTLLMELAFDARIDRDHPLFQEALRRRPDPFNTDPKGKTALQIARERARENNRGIFQGKVEALQMYQNSWIANEKKAKARNVLTAMSATGEAAGHTLPPDLQGKVAEALSGKGGTIPMQLAALRYNAEHPQEDPRSGGGGGGGAAGRPRRRKGTRRTRRRNRKQTRKSRH